MTSAIAMLLALLQSAGSSTPPPITAPAPEAVPTDPSRIVFPAGTSGLVLVLVKADRTADYEAVITAVATALQGADPASRARAEGWKVFKAQEADAKGNAIYVHWLASPAPEMDYRPSAVLELLMAKLPEAEVVKYRDALAAPPTRLALGLLADLALAPVAKPPR